MGNSKQTKGPKAAAAPSARSRKKAPAKVVPPGVGEACGISSFAAELGANEDFTAAVICSFLTGIAGPETRIEAPWGRSRLPKLDLLVSKEDLPASRLIDCLATPLEDLNRQLAQNMALSHPEAVETLARGSFSSAPPKKGRPEKTDDRTLRRNLEFLTSPPSGGLQADLVLDPMVQRMEAILHPRVLVIKASGRHLPALVAGCHGSSALVVEPNLGLDREGSEPAQVIRELLPLLDGSVSPDQGIRTHPRSNSELTRAQLILSLGREEREALPGVGSALLDRLLWLRGGGVRQTIPAKPEDSANFFTAYRTAIQKIVELRREGKPLVADFESAETCRRFYTALRVYEGEVIAMGALPGPSVLGLPQTLFFGIWFLRDALPGGDPISDEAIITCVFDSARRLVGIHNAQVLELRNASLVDDRKLIARRVVEKLGPEKTPLKLRELKRLFRNQKNERIKPVIDALVEVQVLLETESGSYELGPADLDEVMEVLVGKFGGKGDADP